ncbi:uncharacterized protein [Oryza sativa Japonica Group]|uniref:Os02g0253700 protein n=2 Tax=Oryza sativa subsp. japonica TaxID=39947 RepID=Q6ET11_ORYSJ|nr:uncharacterized protein LOC4328907 [Oryza sativa Japonica Group]KAF2944040.1 hypothetical protein DAI22_02g110600 [Oryza sativa Japonica Group]BAD28209.1 unknown protein [Oryza sativa Japonica Group]BAF08369.1 Os02g0253700 [Oryza sativa Japonica Group]BAG93024.1 unnamed protein product [Oryza sativa Japonica Group]BAS77927.1 Os02g0253700 [Oryza sativa Japonica Group]|eukprot:NP_001046455.1 Os02g0253700 [Oryza sativa Japonica Group]
MSGSVHLASPAINKYDRPSLDFVPPRLKIPAGTIEESVIGGGTIDHVTNKKDVERQTTKPIGVMAPQDTWCRMDPKSLQQSEVDGHEGCSQNMLGYLHLASPAINKYDSRSLDFVPPHLKIPAGPIEESVRGRGTIDHVTNKKDVERQTTKPIGVMAPQDTWCRVDPKSLQQSEVDGHEGRSPKDSIYTNCTIPHRYSLPSKDDKDQCEYPWTKSSNQYPRTSRYYHGYYPPSSYNEGGFTPSIYIERGPSPWRHHKGDSSSSRYDGEGSSPPSHYEDSYRPSNVSWNRVFSALWRW